MTIATPEYDQTTETMSQISSCASVASHVWPNQETRVPSEVSNFYSLISISGMTKTPLTVSEFLKQNFAALPDVKAVLAGKSADVLHVWVLVGLWTPEVRKQVYAVQKSIMKQLGGLYFDFYVVDLPEGTKPREIVSDIPVIFDRAEQESTSAHS